MTSPAEPGSALPVYNGAEAIGGARSWPEVIRLLVARGLGQREADNAVLTRGIRTDTAFHVVAAGPEAQMLAALRAIRSAGGGP